MREKFFFRIENLREAALLERAHIEPTVCLIDPGGIAYDIDEPVERMQAAEQVIVLAVGTGKKRSEMPEANALQANVSAEPGQGMGVVRAHAIDQYFPQFADLACAADGKGKNIPEWETEIVDQDLAAGLWMPFCRIERSEQLVELARARIQIDFTG